MTGLRLSWRDSATPSRRSWWVLGRSERRTSGTGHGSSADWKTVRAGEHGQYQRDRGTPGLERATLTGQVKDWQTPNAMAGGNKSRGGERKGELLLAGQVKEWTTPQAHDSKGTPDAKRVGRHGTKHGGRNLPDDVAANWPSPGANDDKALGEATPGHSPQLRHVPGLLAQGSRSTGGKPRGCLNSRWVASLMGYPSDWCDVPTSKP